MITPGESCQEMHFTLWILMDFLGILSLKDFLIHEILGPGRVLKEDNFQNNLIFVASSLCKDDILNVLFDKVTQ